MPVLGLRLTAGPIELRGVTDEDLPVLADLASRGVHEADAMPFMVPWTQGSPEEISRAVAAYHWRCRGEWSLDRWSMQLGVWHEGALVGCQGLDAEDFLVTRTAETGSWLGMEHHGQGIGTAMRQVICAFAFDHLDAEEITSCAFADNPASQAVSRKVGYRENGRRRVKRGPGQGKLAQEQLFVLCREDLNRYEEPLNVSGLEALRGSMGLGTH